jgi:hypothetical protein
MSQTGRAAGQLVLSRQAAHTALTQNGLGLLQSGSREQPTGGAVSSPTSGGRGKPQAAVTTSSSESALQRAIDRSFPPGKQLRFWIPTDLTLSTGGALCQARVCRRSIARSK